MIRLLKISGAVYDETRILILAFLLKHEECCVCELTASLNLGQSRISRHLSILEDAGFLETSRRGKWIYYSVSTDINSVMSEILAHIKSINLELPQKIEACEIKKGETK